jgi:hypothetical protein
MFLFSFGRTSLKPERIKRKSQNGLINYKDTKGKCRHLK